MSRARLRALALGLAALVAAAAIAFALVPREPKPRSPRAAGERPELLLLTSLPLVFNEQFSLQGGSPALEVLQARYGVRPISTTSRKELVGARLLLMAQPLSQTAENLVDLDEWVRRGGRAMLLADPRLEWPSKRPLGDPLKPPPMFMDTGLLAHWGLRLDAPAERGAKATKLAGYDVTAVSPGVLSGRCPISGDGLVAHCRIGRGRATVIADADLLDVGDLGRSGHNLDAVLAELAELQK